MPDDHDYRVCGDADCERFPCRVYKDGYRDGFDAGVEDGYADGYVQGQADFEPKIIYVYVDSGG